MLFRQFEFRGSLLSHVIDDPRIRQNITKEAEFNSEENSFSKNKAGEDLPQSSPKGHVSSPHATTSFTGEVNAGGLCNSKIKVSTA